MKLRVLAAAVAAVLSSAASAAVIPLPTPLDQLPGAYDSGAVSVGAGPLSDSYVFALTSPQSFFGAVLAAVSPEGSSFANPAVTLFALDPGFNPIGSFALPVDTSVAGLVSSTVLGTVLPGGLYAYNLSGDVGGSLDYRLFLAAVAIPAGDVPIGETGTLALGGLAAMGVAALRRRLGRVPQRRAA